MNLTRIGTRQSDLALTQTRMVAQSLNSQSLPNEIVKVVTTGDKDLRSFDKIPGDGFFTKELEKKLIKKEIDLAVHSCKDLPSMTHYELPWVAYSHRESTFDILITRKENLSSDGHPIRPLRIGTSSPRRYYQLKSLYPGCEILQMRGNVPSRIQKALSSEFDATVLAEAGVSRLGLLQTLEEKGLVAIRLPTVSAACQGILAIQMRRENINTYAPLFNSDLNQIAHAEKSILALFGGGCHLALGANIHKTPSGQFHLKFYYHDTVTETQFEEKYATLTDLLRDTVNRTLKIKESTSRVWLTQPSQHQIEIIKKFKDTGIQPIPLPLTEVRPTWTYEQLVAAYEKFNQVTSLVFTSRFGVRLFFLEFISCFPELYDQLSAKKVYCIGPATQKEFKNYCELEISSPQIQTGASLYEILPKSDVPLLVGTEDSELKKLFEKSRRNYTFLSLYKSLKHDSPLNDFTSIKNGDRVVITSPKAAEYFSQIYQPAGPKLHIFAFGPTTAKKLEALKIPHTVNLVSGSWDAMVNEVLKTK